MMKAIETIQAILRERPASEFDGVDDPVDPGMICQSTLSEALEERLRFYAEQDPDLMRTFAHAFLGCIDWYDLAGRKLKEWTHEQA
jgi:hypothetical protein